MSFGRTFFIEKLNIRNALSKNNEPIKELSMSLYLNIQIEMSNTLFQHPKFLCQNLVILDVYVHTPCFDTIPNLILDFRPRGLKLLARATHIRVELYDPDYVILYYSAVEVVCAQVCSPVAASEAST